MANNNKNNNNKSWQIYSQISAYSLDINNFQVYICIFVYFTYTQWNCVYLCSCSCSCSCIHSTYTVYYISSFNQDANYSQFPFYSSDHCLFCWCYFVSFEHKFLCFFISVHSPFWYSISYEIPFHSLSLYCAINSSSFLFTFLNHLRLYVMFMLHTQTNRCTDHFQFLPSWAIFQVFQLMRTPLCIDTL